MKNRFSTVDIFAAINELNALLKGSRIGNIYDVSHRVYLLKFSRDEVKRTLLIESGIRFHLTNYDWPKSPAPSSFSMKLRKHTRNKILLNIVQLGVDRVVDFQFGFNSVLYHVIVELYDRGNIFLCDAEFKILNALRPRTDHDSDVKFIVGEVYPHQDAKESSPVLSSSDLKNLLSKYKPSDPLKRVLIPNTLYGPSLIDHSIRQAGLNQSVKINQMEDEDLRVSKIEGILRYAESIFTQIKSCESFQGFITFKTETGNVKGEEKSIKSFIEFHPFNFSHISESEFDTFGTFNEAVDSFFSLIESQKIDAKTLQQEKQVLKKLENVRQDHEQRLKALENAQIGNRRKGELIKINLQTVDKALTVIRSALANKMTWAEVWEIVEDAKTQNDPVASKITKLKLQVNKFEMQLSDDVYDCLYDDMSSESSTGEANDKDGEVHSAIVEIDISKTAYANARSYFDNVRFATQKEQKTIEASKKAFENAEKITQQSLKQIDVSARIEKLRKTYWFEKFLWFISSDNMIVIGGHDQQQNELIVKKYLKKGDIYVHADIHGATSVIVKNPAASPIPPRTLQEAASMAVCYSSAWDAKVWQEAWWVHADQVSKTAPTGEYLTTGSFMVRGKRNYIAQPQLIMGFGFLFCLEQQSMLRHKGERGNRSAMDPQSRQMSTDSDISRVQSLPGAISDYVLGDLSEDPSNENSDKDNAEPNSENDPKSDQELFDSEERGPKEQEGETKAEEVELEPNVETAKAGIYESEEDSKTSSNILFQEFVASEKMTNENASKNKNDKLFGDQCSKGDFKSGGEFPSGKNGKSASGSQSQSKEENRSSNSGQTMKRGQKSKLKKIKQKYGDQDDEEREARMAILGSAGPVKEKKKSKQLQKQATAAANGKKNRVKSAQSVGKVIYDPNYVPNSSVVNPDKLSETRPATSSVVSDEKIQQQQSGVKIKLEGDDVSDEEEDIEIRTENLFGELDELTGQPLPEDELLFALPVCAPYSALLNYKYKVKLIPGTGKRGKVIKTALYMFTSMKESVPYEKTLIQSVKDGDLTRNVPGKVKLSAPNMTKLAKR